MLPISAELIQKMEEISTNLQRKYRHMEKDAHRVRQLLQKEGAQFYSLQSLSKEELQTWLQMREVAAVDGSVNQTDGDFPYVIYLFQALAKTTTGIQCLTTDVHTPLLAEEEIEGSSTHWRAQILSTLELQVASTLIEEADLAILLMDGALYHYRIDAPDEWEKLRKKALQKNVLLVGVSEEITTENMVTLPSFTPYAGHMHYDRDLLFGVLREGEIVYVDQIQRKEGLASAWMRLSSNPAIAGFDMLEEQADQMIEVGRLLRSLTPKGGRGIPLWLDYVDREVRITDEFVHALVEQYIDLDIRQRFFTRKRQNRPY